jgi:hypothetical protein
MGYIDFMRRKRRTYRVGDRFGYLTLEQYAGARKIGAKNKSRWLCRCDCGDLVEAWQESLAKGRTVSCKKHHSISAALKGRKLLQPRYMTHGQTRRGVRSPTYSSWMAMIARLTQPSCSGYAHYRKLGITMCERWKTFENFLEDMGARPSQAYSIERIDNNGHYEPGNCRWATRGEQAINRRTTLFFDWQGRKHTLKQLAEISGQPLERLRFRLLRAKWPLERAMVP